MKQNKIENPSQAQIEQIIILFNQGKLLDVIKKTKLLITKYPNSIFLWNMLGVSYARQKKLRDAKKCFENSIKIKPNFVEAHYNLGKTQKELGNLSDAASSYMEAIKLKPDYAEAHNNLGNIHKDTGKFSNAISSYMEAIKLKSNYSEANYNLANTQKELGNLTDAISSYMEAIKIKPDYSEAYNELGGTQIELGNIKDAKSSYLKAIQLNPNYAECYNNYTDAVKIKINDPILSQLEKLVNSKKLSEKQKRYSSFAMAKAQIDIGNFEKGFDFLNIGNATRKKELNYKISKSKEEFYKIKKFFGELNIKKKLLNDATNTCPIFILGMPRSGTTLVEQILSTHSSIYGAGELELLNNSINSSNWENLGEIRKKYFFQFNKISKFSHVIDKMPLNFKWVGFIVCAVPEAKIIHVKRNSIATCWSNYKTNFSKDGMGFSFNQKDVAEYYNLYEDLMKFWHKKFKKKIYHLNYESLTENLERETRKLFDYLDLPWEKNVLNFHKNKRSIKTSSNIQVRKKIYQGSSKEWKKYKKWLQPMIEVLSKK